MRAIPQIDRSFIETSDAYDADDADDRTAFASWVARDVGKIVRQIDDGTRWRVTAVTAGVATYVQLMGASVTAAQHGAQTATNLHASATSLAAGFMTAAQVLVLEGVGLAEPVTVPQGSSATTVQTTTATLAAKNTSRTARVVLQMSLAPELVSVRSGEIKFSVSWLDNDTQLIEQLDVAVENYDAGATPAITVTLPNSVDVTLTLNANHTVTIAVAQSATHARSVWSRYWLDALTQQADLLPSFVSATCNNAGSEIALTVDIALDDTSVPAAESFTLHGTSATVDSVAIVTTVVTLTLSGTVVHGETVTVDYTAPEEDPLIALDGGLEMATAAGWACTNAAPPNPSTIVTAVDGSTIVLTYQDSLNESSVPAAEAFTLVGTAETVASVGISGAAVTLTLSGNIAYGDSVTVSYAIPETNQIKEVTTGYVCYALTTEAVTNAVAPAFVSATTDHTGETITLTYEGALDDGETPPSGDVFTLGGTSATVASVAFSGSTVILTIETALAEYGETVTISYAVPEENPILSAEGFPVLLLSTEACTNITPPDLVSATTNAAGTSIAVTFEGALIESPLPAAGSFTLAGTSATVASVGISGAVLTITLTGTVLYGETVLLTYVVPGENSLRELTTEYACIAFADQAVTDIVPPLFVSATTNAAGDEITMTYEGALDETSTPANVDFAIGGDDATVDSVNVTGSTVVLTLSGAIENGDAVTLSYTGDANKIQSALGYVCADLVTESVTNVVPPLFVSATSNNAGTEITLTYEGNLDDGATPPSGTAFTLAGTSATVASVALSGTDVTLTLETALVEYGETVTVSYEVPGENPLIGEEGESVAALTTEAVTNITPPDVVSIEADADGDAIVVTFEGNLDAASEPAIGAFALSGTTATLDSVTSIVDAVLTLALSGNIAFGESPLLSYTVPGENPLQENTTEYDCVAFTEQAVTNEVPPLLTALITNTLGTEITATYSAALDEASVPDADDFAIGGDDATVSAVYVDGSTVRLALDGAIEYGDSPTVTYTADTNPIRSDVGNFDVVDLVAEACTNAVPPGYSAGATNEGGTEITLTWDGNLNESSEPDPSCFDINGDDATVASLNVSGATCVLTLSGTIENGDTITVDYTVPESNPLQSAEGYDLAQLTAAAVTNNVPA